MKDKILILGSIASGKTSLANKIAEWFSIPVIHVDQIEFNPDLTKKNRDVIRAELSNLLSQPRWVLDGHGPLDMLPEHLENADTIIFLDFPWIRNVLWLIKRQLRVRFIPRPELPKGANEWQPGHFTKMYQTLRKQHRLMNPELLRILNIPQNKPKLVHIQTRRQLKQFLKSFPDLS